jgi:PAS domain S-box-containing protein
LSVFPIAGDEFTVVVDNVTDRKLAHERLAREKELLRVTLQSVGDAVVATDATGGVTFLNPVAERLTGCTAEAVIGRPLTDIFHIINALTREHTENPVERVLADGIVVGLANHTVLISADGEEYQIADSAAPIRDAAGEIIGVVLVFRDVTAEYAAQQRLSERERDMRRAQRLANLGSWRFNLDSGTVTASAEARRVYGLGDGDLTIALAQAIPLPHYREKLDAALADLIAHGRPYDVEFEIRRENDGEIRSIHSIAEYDAEHNVVIGTLHDVTAAKRTERVLRAERERFAMITELSPIGITTVDAEGVITYANSAAEHILGLRRDEITARTYNAPQWELTGPGGGPFPDEALPFSIVRRTLEPVVGVRHGITWPDGTHVELSVNASPVLDADGSFSGMVATIEDITEHHRAEERVQVLLREKELLLRESHHRITNNMNTLYGLLSLQSEAADAPRAREALADAANRVHSMARLYDRLFRNTLTGSMSIRGFLVPLIHEIVEILAPRVPVQVSADVDDVLIDARTLTTLGIAMNELVTNSVKHAFAEKETGHITVTAVRRDSRIMLTYRDDGPGLRADVFAPETAGFGLQLVDMLCGNLDGAMRVRPDEGLRIELEIPDPSADGG